jgi:CysZ protein
MEGLQLLWHRRIRWLVIIPLMINILLFSALTWWVGAWVGDWLDWLTA